MKIAKDAMDDFVAMNEVLAARLPMLALTMACPTPARLEEAERMVQEKADAAIEGMFSLQKYCMDTMFSAWQAPLDHAHLEGAVAAYLEPARQKLHANADRLRDRTDV